ncbi:phage tail protein [Photorhabdus temperata]|uniref:Phage-related tail fiber protein n=1 Tax=Photorhabdus temperata subsp. temperata Meg1 TaxID=1393735 RepID=A0A081RXB6_PHOTE|nr:phage tail protein [Photorhabdus temperata]KER03319.1 phage-related tail fiber protein [Photorhabdus temperata subsp. temperata Meg1]
MSNEYNKPDVPVSEDGDFVVVPTPKYVKKTIEEHALSRNHPNATLQDKGFVVLSNDVGSNSETMAATPKAVKAAYDLASTANQNATKPQTKGSIKSVIGSWNVNSTISIPADLRGQVITFVRLSGLNARHQALPVPLVDGITEQRLAGPDNNWVWLEFQFSDNSTHITVIHGNGANFIQIFYRE